MSPPPPQVRTSSYAYAWPSTSQLGFDVEFFFAANTAVNLSLFSGFTLPTIVFGTLCVVGLVLIKKINRKLKLILVNVIAVDILYSVGQILWYLGYPLH